MATQTERRAETRERLLHAAVELIAERGVDGASVDAIAERAGRTSGAVYDHFNGKDGLLFALVHDLVDVVSENVVAELADARTLDEGISVLWRNISSPGGDTETWMTLEYELWAYSARRPEIREHLARRYRMAWRGILAVVENWTTAAAGTGPAVIGTMFGLEMLRRIDPGSMPESLAVQTLLAVIERSESGVRP